VTAESVREGHVERVCRGAATDALPVLGATDDASPAERRRSPKRSRTWRFHLRRSTIRRRRELGKHPDPGRA